MVRAAAGRDATTLANADFEEQRAEQVVGRTDELARIAAYVAGGTVLPLVVSGPAGSGKSTVLAEVTKRVPHMLPGAVVITRHIGVTPGTSSLNELLNELRQAIASAYGQTEPAPIDDPEELVSARAAQLATQAVPPERPLVLVVDALDQLGTQAHRTGRLPPRLAPHVRMVVSVIADRPEYIRLRAQLPGDQILSLAPLSREAGRAMLRYLLAADPRRTLASAQEEAVPDTSPPKGCRCILGWRQPKCDDGARLTRPALERSPCLRRSQASWERSWPGWKRWRGWVGRWLATHWATWLPPALAQLKTNCLTWWPAMTPCAMRSTLSPRIRH